MAAEQKKVLSWATPETAALAAIGGIAEPAAPQPAETMARPSKSLSSVDEAIARIQSSHEHWTREALSSIKATKALIATTETLAGEFAKLRTEISGLREDLGKLTVWQNAQADRREAAKLEALSRPVRVAVSRGQDKMINGAEIRQ